jgi:hypothetical protein
MGIRFEGLTNLDEFQDVDTPFAGARENLIEHVFLGELLRGLWRKNVRDLEVLRLVTSNSNLASRGHGLYPLDIL